LELQNIIVPLFLGIIFGPYFKIFSQPPSSHLVCSCRLLQYSAFFTPIGLNPLPIYPANSLGANMPRRRRRIKLPAIIGVQLTFCFSSSTFSSSKPLFFPAQYFPLLHPPPIPSSKLAAIHR
jgi:hypothetical protein